MKRAAMLCICGMLCLFPACGAGTDAPTQDPSGEETQESSAPQSASSVPEEETMLTVTISVGGNAFTATLYDNPAAKAFLELLPLTLDMRELNGNEKYFYLEQTFPTDASRPSGIHAGDLMLYGNNCLVLFYESFSTSYSYTTLGRIDNPEGLASALGSGGVQVTFRRG